MTDITTDAILDGRLLLGQPARGHRAGTDAILAAAAVPAKPGDSIADFGAGVGTAGLAVLVRVPNTRALLVEIDHEAAVLAEANAVANGLEGRVRVLELDVATLGTGATAALMGSADHVVSNPPFNAPGGRPSPDAAKARAHVAPEGQIEDWMRAASRVLRPGGTVTLIHRPEALNEILTALSRRFGGVTLRFIHPEEASASNRVLVQAKKDSRAPLKVVPALVLNAPDGGFTAEAEALHRRPAALDMS